LPNFTTFTKRLIPLTKAPYVTIQRRGTMSLNAAAHAAVGSPKAVELLYDPDAKIIGFRAVDPAVEHAYALRTANNGTSFILSGRAFTNHFEIATDTSTRYPAAMDGDVLCVDISQGGTEVTSNRKKSPAPDESGADTLL
jgi:hypothetical protein